jgi:hypothetical protein
MILCPGQEGKVYPGFSTIVPKTFQVSYFMGLRSLDPLLFAQFGIM